MANPPTSSEGKRWRVSGTKPTTGQGAHFWVTGPEPPPAQVADASEVERLEKRLEEFVAADKTAQVRIKELDEFLDATEAEVERLRELAAAGDALFRWLQDHYPNGLVAAPANIMQRLQRASVALHPDEEAS